MSDKNASIHYVSPTKVEPVSSNCQNSNAALSKGTDFTKPVMLDVSAEADRILANGGGAVNNIVDFSEGDLFSVSYIKQRPDGYYFDLSEIEKDPMAFYKFADRAFSSGNYLFKLDYPVFSKLAFDRENTEKIKNELAQRGIAPEVRFATDVIRMPEERRSLYRTVKVTKTATEAEYFFEPLTVDAITISKDENGNESEITESKTAKLDFDEFVAYVWTKGVKFGLMEEDIRAHISSGSGWKIIARQKDKTPSEDATTKEATQKLKQDRSPRILEGGKVDLKHFKNRFPQVSEGENLLEKIPRKIGECGMSVSGTIINPDLPKDFDLKKIAGPGTKIELINGHEFLIASKKGYVDIDVKSNVISINDKIIHREGVNIRQTGSLDLEGDEYEEHGDVEAGSEVKGQSIHVKGNVYGSVFSRSGGIVVGGNAMNGRILSKGNSVVIQGITSGSAINAPDAEVTLKTAENSLIIGKKVTVEYAKNCTILAEEACVAQSAGSSIGTKKIDVGATDVSNSGNETVIILEIPDVSELRRVLDELEERIGIKSSLADTERKKRAAIAKRYDELVNSAPVQEYLHKNRAAKEILTNKGKITAEQAKTLQEAKAAADASIRLINNASALIKQLDGTIASLEAEIVALLNEKQNEEANIVQTQSGISVNIGAIMGETIIRTRTYSKNNPQLAALGSVTEIRKASMEPGSPSERIYSGSAGKFDWTYQADIYKES